MRMAGRGLILMTQNTDIRATYPNRMRKCNLVDGRRLDDDLLEERDREHTCHPQKRSSNVRVWT
jgi:hypothetical protein